MKSQNEKILKAMQCGWITPIYALKAFGCMRLAARVADLKAAGHAIKSKWINSFSGARYKAYAIAKVGTK